MSDDPVTSTYFRARRLGLGDRELARRLFTMMAEVFDEPFRPLEDGYLDRLLARPDFWALAACDGEEPVGGVTAHAMPMTRQASTELFVYDIAVRDDRQRQGIGRLLLTRLRESAAQAGITEIFVAADADDTHALDFYRALGSDEAPVVMFTLARDGRDA